MPYLIKQLIKAEQCLTRKEAKKVLKKIERLDVIHMFHLLNIENRYPFGACCAWFHSNYSH